ncbi:MAG: PhoPQ-activated protein PqaA family protein [Fimbriimonas sp.]|nr:PhoPQ-activated protein PqaA family protein [Fimbriimonas sp.]
MLNLLFASVLIRSEAPHELYDYLAIKDSSFHYEYRDRAKGEIEMTSQIWQGRPWKHTILMRQPSRLQTHGTAILFITGDGPFKGDYSDLGLITEATGMPTAMLFDIPNQPIYGMKEDDLIAHTFEEYLSTGDATWPLLFPMTKSAIRAMDAVVALTKGTENPIHNFVVTGASKRGWTTWFVGASKDKRVKAIAPMVIDNLNVPRQMKHQMDSWGAYSEEIQDYTRRGLQAKLATPQGQRLGLIVDPYSYRSNITMPTLIVKGANDPYWTVDALSQYWDDLHQPKWAVTVPNAGHDLGNKIEAIESIGAFARSIAGDFRMPKQSWSLEEIPGDKRALKVSLDSNGPKLVKLAVWVAEADNLDFRKSTYKVAGALKIDGAKPGVSRPSIIVPIAADHNVAVFAEARYLVGRRQFSLCCPTQVFKKLN